MDTFTYQPPYPSFPPSLPPSLTSSSASSKRNDWPSCFHFLKYDAGRSLPPSSSSSLPPSPVLGEGEEDIIG